MLLALYAIALVSAALIVVAGFRVRHVFFGRPVEAPGSLDTTQNLHSRYLPMEKLLNDNDMDFLRAQGSLPQPVIARLRADRRRIFRQYLRMMSADFGRLIAVGRLLLAGVSQPHPELAKQLVLARLLFAAAVLAIEFRLLVHASGLSHASVSVRPLVAQLDAIRAQFEGFLAAPGRVALGS